MTREDLIITIIKQTGLSRKEIDQMIQYKKKKLKPFISDKLALWLIAKKLCIDIK